jgi:hypothetical protein
MFMEIIEGSYLDSKIKKVCRQVFKPYQNSLPTLKKKRRSPFPLMVWLNRATIL